MQRSAVFMPTLILVVVGAALVVVGLFLPILSCKDGTAYSPYCEDSKLFQTDSDGFNATLQDNFFAITLLMVLLAGIYTAFRGQGLLPVAGTLLGFMAYIFYIAAYQASEFETYNLGFAWLFLIGGGLVVLGGGLALIMSRPRSVGYSSPYASPYQQPYGYDQYYQPQQPQAPYQPNDWSRRK